MSIRHPQINPRILGYLGRALSLELSAVQQYMTQAKLAELWQLGDAAAHLRQEVVEEMQHAERIVERMLLLGVAPNASQLRPVRAGRTLQELLVQDHAMEQLIVDHYRDAAAYCARIGDSEHQAFFEELLGEELEHAKELMDWIGRLSSGNATG
jgi:bacterioferritin